MNWITQFFDRFFSFVPRLFVVDPDESGVRTTPQLKKGMRIKELSPGWWIVWPVIQNVEKIKITPQVVDLRGQALTTKDDKTILVSGAIQYRVSNAQRAILNVFDYDKGIQTLALGIIARFINERIFEDCRIIKKLEEEILKDVREAASGWGLKLMQCFITDLCETKSYCIVGGGKIVPIQEEVF